MASSSHALAAEEDAIRVAPPELAPGVEDSAGTTNHVEQEEEEDSEAVDEDGEEEDASLAKMAKTDKIKDALNGTLCKLTSAMLHNTSLLSSH